MPYKFKGKRDCTQSDGSKGAFQTIKKDGSKRCYKSEKQYKASQAWAHEYDEAGYGEEINEDVMRVLVKDFVLEESKKLEAETLGSAINSITGDVEKSYWKGPQPKKGYPTGHYRFTTGSTHSRSEAELKKVAVQAVQAAFGVQKATAAGKGSAHSQKYNTIEVTDSETGKVYNIVFATTATGGQRGGGYEYEENLEATLNSIPGYYVGSGVGTDSKYSDIFIPMPSGQKIGIEVKGKGAKFGQPTLQFNFSTNKFLVPKTSRSKENANMVASVLNAANDQATHTWLASMKNVYDTRHPSNPMTIWSTQVQLSDWEEIKQKGIKSSGSPVDIDPGEIIRYYRRKKAHYIQIEGKGLYAIDDVLELNITSFFDVIRGESPYVTPDILSSGGNKVIRATINLNYSKLSPSNFDLENPVDQQLLTSALGLDTDVSGVDYDLWAHHDPRRSGQINLSEMKLIVEELTGADKSEIKRMIAKEIEGVSNKRETKKIFQAEFNRELKKALGTSFIGEPGKINKFVRDAIQKEIESMFKDKATQNQIGEITKAVIKKLYRELSYSSVHIVDRIKL